MGRYSFKLPDVGEGIAEAEITAWHVQVGELVEEDNPLVDVMTDKATVEITSPVTGKVISLEGVVGKASSIGSVIAVLEVEGIEDSAPPVEPASVNPKEVQPAPLSEDSRVDAPHAPPQRVEAAKAPPSASRAEPLSPPTAVRRVLASPAVRREAIELGVDLRRVRGSGDDGRVLRADLRGAASDDPPLASFLPDQIEDVQVIGLRRRIAERMSEAKRRIPHFSYIEEVDVTELERLRQQLNAEFAQRGKLTVLPMIAKALVQALKGYPQINAIYDDDAGVVHRHSSVHLGIATQTPTGLVVPVIRHVERLDLWETANELARLAEAARSGKASREELGGSTITITSLGPMGGVGTTPVINRPEVAIIGPNKIVERPVVVAGEVVIRKMMNVSSSFDHRVVDGWDAAEFIQKLKKLLENPALMFVEAK